MSEKFAPRKGEGEKPAVLLIHGFGGSPYDFKPLLDALDDEGWAYEAILLPGHGTSPKDLKNMNAEELLDAAFGAYDRMEAEHGDVVVAGFSMGGAITLNIAAERDPAGIVLFGPYVEVTRKWYYFGRAEDWARRLHKILPYVKKVGSGNVNDPEGKRLYDSYHHLPVKTVMELEKIGIMAREKSGDVKCSVLWFHSREDIASDYKVAHAYYDQIPSEKKDFITYKRSNHVILFDYDGPDAVKRSVEFLKRSGDR